jgi:molybdopterin molybdotransferase
VHVPTIAQHRETIAALVGPVLAGICEAGIGEGGFEARRVLDLVRDPGAGRGFRTIGQRIVAPVDLPPFDNSQMDGFAVRSSEGGAEARVVAPIPAGMVPPALVPGTAAPIMTGSRLPAGADAVVPVEEVGPGSFPGALGLATLTVPVLRPDTFVRRRGSDLKAGDELVGAGAALTPSVLGLLAASGVTDVVVVRRPRVLVVSTGSELGSPDGRASIGDANGTSLAAALAEVGVDARSILVPDDSEVFLAELDAALHDQTDLVITTGGISMGAFEVVRQALEPRGLMVTSVAMQPGGPQASGIVTIGEHTVPLVAFPGNPVSALVSFEVFLRPLFAAAVHLQDREEMTLPAAESADSPGGKDQVRRGTVVDGRVHFVGGASSHLLAHYAAATHLVLVPIGVDRVEPGDPLTVWRIR